MKISHLACGAAFLFGCAGEPEKKVVEEVPSGEDRVVLAKNEVEPKRPVPKFVRPGHKEMSDLLVKCKLEFEYFFAQELCVVSERRKIGEDDVKSDVNKVYEVPEVDYFYKVMANLDYSEKEKKNHDHEVANMLNFLLKECKEGIPESKKQLTVKCYQVMLYEVLVTWEKGILSGNLNDEEIKEVLYYYFLVLNFWLSSLR